MPSDTELQLLTHYALGELPPARLPEVEALLAQDPAARAWVSEVRTTATELAESLGREATAGVGLDAGRKAAITAQAAIPPGRPLRFRPWMVLTGGLLAASLVVALTVPALSQSRTQLPQPVVATNCPAPGDPSALWQQTVPPLKNSDLMPKAEEFDVSRDATAPVASLYLSRSMSELQPIAPENEDQRPMGREVAIEDRYATREETMADLALGAGAAGRFVSLGAAFDGSEPRARKQGAADQDAKIAVPATPAIPAAGKPGAAGMYGHRVGPTEPAGIPPQPLVAGQPAPVAGESYARVVESAFQDPQVAPLSTFGLDVDTAAYANVRRFLDQGQLPPPEAVRIEEMLNAFTYSDPPPAPGSDQPFNVRVELAECPWAAGHRLARIAVTAMPVERGQRPPCNLVFLVDVSGSMGEAKKLVLVKKSLVLLASQLRADDRVAIVTYSDATRVALPSTPGSERAAIVAAVQALSANGSTNGAAGIQLAYQTAQANAVAGVNRVILCTDGDFNVGVQSPQELQRLIEEKRKSGVTLTVLGYGMGNLKDANLQILADKGNGTYAYIDSEDEAHQALVRQLDRHLVMVAKDAKVQVEFNPARVASWRLIGYEKRQLRAQDFNNDRVDSGDIGAGAHVIALYELEPRPTPVEIQAEPRRYQGAAIAAEERWDAEVMFVKLRWKRPDLDRSELIRLPVVDRNQRYRGSSADFRFAAAVAAFGLVLRDSPHRGEASLALAAELANSALGSDEDGRRAEFVRLVRRAAELGGGR